MVINENLEDCSNKIIHEFAYKCNRLNKVNTQLAVILLITLILLLVSLVFNVSYQNDIKEFKKVIQQDEQIITIEHSIGYWFINEPEPVTDSILYQFLLDNNAWYPDILLKQAKLESGNYTSNVFKNTNNLYGMKIVGKRQTTQLNNTYNGYGCYNNWCESVLDRILWDVFRFNNVKPTKEEYLKALEQYAECRDYIQRISNTK